MFTPPSDSTAHAGYASAADEQSDSSPAAPSPSTTSDRDVKPFSVSSAGAFPSGGTKEGAGEADAGMHCKVSPDGRSKTWTTIGQDQAGKDHPFMQKVVRYKSSTGLTVVNKTQTHWTLATSKDGKTRHVHYQTTLDEAVYDASGREYSHHKRSYNGSFDTDKPLPFESPSPSAGSGGVGWDSDDQARKRRDEDRNASRQARAPVVQHLDKPDAR